MTMQQKRTHALAKMHNILEELRTKLKEMPSDDFNPGHIRTLTAALLLLYRDRLSIY
jgi:hypothetical protein